MSHPAAIPPMPPSMGEDLDEDRRILGVTRKQRFKIYFWSGLVLVIGFLVWALIYLQLPRWYTYTDQVAFEQVARDVDLGYVLWENAEPAASGFAAGDDIGTPVISSNGARMIYSAGEKDGNANLFLRAWNGNEWGAPRPMRALNSAFHEKSPSLNGDAELLYFTSDRPGGQGGYDIWVAKWDGAEYAWPLPLTPRVNTPFDEIDPDLAPDNLVLYFASNRPRRATGTSEKVAAMLEDVEERKGNFDLYSADAAGDPGFDLIVERQLSMLYSLRESALADPKIMAKLGGSTQTESAVDKGLAYLASMQEEDGRWDINKSRGQAGHDQAATAFALLAFYGRGEVHDEKCKYRDNVKRGIEWLVGQQNGATGDLRGERPRNNSMYDHGIAALAVVEAYGVTKDVTLRPKAQAAIDFIAETQHETGGWRYGPNQPGDLSVTGWFIMALGSAKMSGIRVEDKTMEGAAKFLASVSYGKNKGGYGYTGPGRGTEAMNAAGFFCAQLLGYSSNSHKAFESSQIVDHQGFKLNDIYYAYYGTVASYQHQGPAWRKWMKAMQPAFVKSQTSDGSWNPGGGHGGAMGRVIATALVTLCLEAHYRYTPLYGLGWEPDEKGPTGSSKDRVDLADTPLFRHAKFINEWSSPENDTGPVLTDHGDFLYFASERGGGEGGADLYRTRIKGTKGPENLGPEINSEGDETNPAVRNAGFHLLFNSNRMQNENALYSARSKRVERRYDLTKLPDLNWIVGNIFWILGLLASLIGFLWLSKRALTAGKAAPKTPTLPDDAPPDPTS